MWTAIAFVGGLFAGMALGLLVVGLCVMAGKDRERVAQLQRELNRRMREDEQRRMKDADRGSGNEAMVSGTLIGLGRW